MAKALHIDRLPEAARNELYDFYEFLMKKYAPNVRTPRTTAGARSDFFSKVDSHSFTLPADYHFDRDELHER
jgi:hypothetical protein